MINKIVKFLNKYTNESETVDMFLYIAAGSFIVIGILIILICTQIKFFPILLTLFKLFGFISATSLFLCGIYKVIYNIEIEDDENDKRNNNSIDI